MAKREGRPQMPPCSARLSLFTLPIPLPTCGSEGVGATRTPALRGETQSHLFGTCSSKVRLLRLSLVQSPPNTHTHTNTHTDTSKCPFELAPGGLWTDALFFLERGASSWEGHCIGGAPPSSSVCALGQLLWLLVRSRDTPCLGWKHGRGGAHQRKVGGAPFSLSKTQGASSWGARRES